MGQEGNNSTIQTDSIETLRQILELEQSRSIIYEEAQDVGEALLTFYEVLAAGASNE